MISLACIRGVDLVGEGYCMGTSVEDSCDFPGLYSGCRFGRRGLLYGDISRGQL